MYQCIFMNKWVFIKGGIQLRDILRDKELKKLLKEKSRLEMFSWIIPLISIFSLIIILFLTSKELEGYTIIVIILLIILIISGYVFDKKFTVKIHQSYSRLNNYIQDIIAPKLLVKDNPSISFHDSEKIDLELIDEILLFNNFTNYNSRFNYSGELENHKFIFNEVIFSNLVEYDTTGQKVFVDNINNEINYHWYTFTLEESYPTEAIYLLAKIDSYDEKLLKSFYNFDYKNLLNKDLELTLFLKDLKESNNFITDDIIKALNKDLIVYNVPIVIYLKNQKLHIIIEEYNDLINLTHSNKIVLESLLKAYYDEQKIIKMIVKAFDKK